MIVNFRRKQRNRLERDGNREAGKDLAEEVSSEQHVDSQK